MVILVDYGMGNIRSIQKHFKRMDIPSDYSSDPDVLSRAEKLVLPGVGNFRSGMEHLIEYGLIDVLNEKAIRDKVPILGICLGMQLLTGHSEEGDTAGLGWIEGETKKFEFGDSSGSLKIPHIGWNSLEIVGESPLLAGIKKEDLFYFVHSYHVVCECRDHIQAETTYGYSFPSVIQKDNILGTQFHPEKSHGAGRQIIRNFVEMV